MLKSINKIASSDNFTGERGIFLPQRSSGRLEFRCISADEGTLTAYLQKHYSRGVTMAIPLDTQDEKKSEVGITNAGGRRWRVGAITALLAGLSVYGGWILLGNRAEGQGPPSAQNFAVPVVAVAAKQGDIHTYITGLGTVTALYTATI